VGVVVIPDKAYLKIGEVARLVGVKPYVLRFWEAEFERDIRPERNRGNQRVYRRRDVEMFLQIKKLRYDEKLEVSGAKKRLRVRAGEEEAPSTRRLAETLSDGLKALIKIVDEDEDGSG
jgi:DNA-binding transcriptional MerR regulator